MCLTRVYFFAPKLVPIAGCNPWLIPQSGMNENAIILRVAAIIDPASSPPYLNA